MVLSVRRRKGGCLGKLLSWCLVVFILAFGARWAMARLFPLPFGPLVTAAAEENGVPPALLYALMKAESNFNPSAQSAKGAKGLMQLMDSTAGWCAEKSGLSYTNILDPEENIALGAYYLGYLLKLYNGNETTAVAAYNAGHGRVDGWLANPAYAPDGKTLTEIPFPETRQYVQKVSLYRKIYAYRLKQD